MYSHGAGFGDLAPSLTFSKIGGGPTAVFHPGESYHIDITGPPNQPVWLVANGLAPMRMGSTDESGRFVLSGEMTAGEIGNWVEMWFVGGETGGGATLFQATNLGTLQFSVAAVVPVPSGGAVPPDGGSRPAGGGAPVPVPVVSGGIPTGYLLAAAGVAALVLFSGGRR